MGTDGRILIPGKVSRSQYLRLEDYLEGLNVFDALEEDEPGVWVSPGFRFSDREAPHPSWPFTRAVITTLRLVANREVRYGSEFDADTPERTTLVTDRWIREHDAAWIEWWGNGDE